MKCIDLSNRPESAAAPRQGRGHGLLHRVRALILTVVALTAVPAIAGDYVNDPTWAWGTGIMLNDAFGGSLSQNYVAGSVARLSNGDVVVAGVVPESNGFGAIGLVRYAANGTSGRVAWTNPGAYGINSGQYVVYPGISQTRISMVRKVIVHGDLMFVLADVETWKIMFPPTFAGDGAAIYVFGTDGSFKNMYLVDKDTEGLGGNGRSVWGGGLATFSEYDENGEHLHLLYIGHKLVDTGNERITFRRYGFTPAGIMTAETSLYHPAISQCGETTHCSGWDIATGGSVVAYAEPRVYITGSRWNNQWEAYVAQINPYSGASYEIGYRKMSNGRGRALAVYPRADYSDTHTDLLDDVYVLAEYDQNCKMGMMVSGWHHRLPQAQIWTKQIGGSNSSGIDCSIDEGVLRIRAVMPTSLALQDGRLAAAGWGTIPPTGGGENIVDAAIAVLDTAGNLISPSEPGSNQPKYYESTDTNGVRIQHSSFAAIVAAGNGAFTAAGVVRIPNTDPSPTRRGKEHYTSLRVTESGGGTTGLLFSDGFEGGGSNPPQPAQFRGTNIGNMTMTPSECDNGNNGPVPDVKFHTFDPRLVDYYASKGMKALRVLFAWECMQKDLNGSIPAAANGNYKTYFDTVKALVDYASNVKGMHVVLTPWAATAGGGVCGACYKGQVIGSGAVTNAHFADFWTKMANHFKSNPRVAFNLINEPHDMSTMDWFSMAQTAVTAIRATGATNRIYVPGNGYSAASTWNLDNPWYDTASPKRNNAYGWLNARGVGQPLLDPQNNMVIEVHTYVNQNQDGGGGDPYSVAVANYITSDTAARDHVKHTVDWARANGLKVYLGEIGMAASNPLAASTWSNFVTYASANTDTLIGFTWWAGGYPGWWDNLNGPWFSITPTNAGTYTGDNANMNLIKSAFQ